ncbi:MAG: photosystem II reaction center protein PsbN [Euryarchaeota archaeon]|nr:photosystem II reaction center protein PsbN [Euryarchaeota archaeon]|tara:strand:+ start:59 stop:223 length:165 start_codon:yes stop_codon:yes gene_type:complete
MSLVFIIIGILFLLVIVGLWFTFGPGSKNIKDPIDEHAKMHELGIAHGHRTKNF